MNRTRKFKNLIHAFDSNTELFVHISNKKTNRTIMTMIGGFSRG